VFENKLSDRSEMELNYASLSYTHLSLSDKDV